MTVPPPTVFLVDDDASILKAVSRLLRSAGFEVAAFASPGEFLASHDREAHGCVVLDVAMPGLSGLELQRTLLAAGTGLPVVFLSGRGDIPMTVKAIKQGAVDFLTKPVEDEQLLAAVRSAITRDRAAWEDRCDLAEIGRCVASLTPREREVLEHVIAGRLNKQTADYLGAAEKTIKIHRARVMEKMRADSLAELIRRAEKAGITPAGAGVRLERM